MFIYALVCPFTQEVKYVGKSNSPKRRLRDHYKELKKCENEKLYNHRQAWLKSLKDKGVKPILIILEVIKDDDWQEREIHWISFYKELGCNLTNSTNGGDGGMNPSEETRRKMSDRKKGVAWSSDHKKNMSESQKRRYEDPEERLKASFYSKQINSRPSVKAIKKEKAIEKWKDPEYKAKTSLAISKGKQKYVYTIKHKNGEEETVLNLRQWCLSNGYTLQSIQQVASGKRNSCHGIKVFRQVIE